MFGSRQAVPMPDYDQNTAGYRHEQDLNGEEAKALGREVHPESAAAPPACGFVTVRSILRPPPIERHHHHHHDRHRHQRHHHSHAAPGQRGMLDSPTPFTALLQRAPTSIACAALPLSSTARAPSLPHRARSLSHHSSGALSPPRPFTA